MRKLLLIAVLLFVGVSCTEEEDCYKCNLVSADGRFGTTTYLKCNVDVDEYMMHMIESGRAGHIECELTK